MKTSLYIARIDPLFDENIYDRWLTKVSEVRKQKVLRVRNHKDKVRSIAAEALLITALRRQKINNVDLSKIIYGKNGKPYLEGLDVYFNLSHSGDMVACAISMAEVGCDVEHKSDQSNRIAKRFFSDNECAYINDKEDETIRQSRFTEIWSLRESILKASGVGVSYMRDDFSVIGSDASVLTELIFPENNKKYFIKSFSYDEYKLAVCSELDNIEEKIERVDLRGEIEDGKRGFGVLFE